MLQTDLVEKCKNNDRRAQLKLYRQYCDAMFCVARRYLHNREDAEDVVQEAFIKAFRKLHQYRQEIAFGAWLKRIVINNCLDRIKREKERLLSVEDVFPEISGEETEGWMVENSLSPKMIAGAMEQLPEGSRYVTMLFLVEGYDHEEISEILGITEVNSRTLLFRGKKKLRELLKAYRKV
ncbi:RNA polymerase sigma factor [Sinomicrobium weinanense]|uniref:RNA polymerase sigma factor n=1 Tax=Sinomicrobium weinanense TaxID=2842200 RepID=A0A926JSN5_9FLAO|nr:RNA polymerase sigma factor [Sinomicrobium weinanense]MBC9796589.1 RNA polymerase sigma factor [Sinomicrobium weinanense]MBU3123573.1 RNA polymerase sigma factor [Sinomicrobium weinanense]